MASRVEQRARARAEREQKERAAREHERKRRRLIELGLLAGVAAIAVAVLVAVSQSGGTQERAPASDLRGEIAALYQGIPQNGAVLGDPKAPVTLVEFADLQCPFCADFDRNVLPSLIDRYVRTGKVRLEIRPMRFLGPDSERAAAVLAATADQDRAWQFLDAFYRRQGPENTGYVTDEFLRETLAAVPGVDVEKALQGSLAPEAEDLPLQAEAEASAADISSTPSFLIGPTGGALANLEFSALETGAFTGPIDAALSRAR